MGGGIGWVARPWRKVQRRLKMGDGDWVAEAQRRLAMGWCGLGSATAAKAQRRSPVLSISIAHCSTG